jgi:molecular chaperone GrpE (heat shock protein)
MRDQMEPKIAKWPFLLGDVLLLGAAGFIVYRNTLPMGPWQTGFIFLCVASGAWLAIMPFLLEYRVVAKLAEAQALATVVAQIQKLEALAGQIGGATGQWQQIQQDAGKAAAAAKEIADRMGQEVQAFSQFMQKTDDGEKATLRLEVDKLRRAEADWLQVLVRMLDHVYALHVGALRSGQPNLIENLTSFQNACRDAARRVGLTPFQPDPAEPFNAERHQLANGDGPAPAEARVGETVATGFTFQGRLLRPALVRLAKNGETPKQLDAAQDKQSHLPLGAAG